jgi:glycosyltransferase involved in cell wall biosynthesis
MPIPKEIQKIAVNVYPQLDLLISVSTALRKNIQEQIGTDSIVIPNMLGHEFLHKTKNEHRNNKIKIITTGRLVEGKKFDLLIRALSNINTPYDLNIIGNGPIKNKLELLIQQLNLTEKIHLLGHKNKNELVCLLEQSDLFVLPSQSETFGVSYIEALACGLPIIATDCGGPKDFVTKENGLLIPTNNLEALKNAIEFMIEHINDYDKVAIAEDCKKRFSPKTIAKELTLIFEKIINKNKNN